MIMSFLILMAFIYWMYQSKNYLYLLSKSDLIDVIKEKNLSSLSNEILLMSEKKVLIDIIKTNT